jgi:hypothetical protein
MPRYMASRRDQENWQEDRLMIFLTAAATKGAQRNKGPDHGIQVVDPLLSPYPPYWLWPVLKSAANYLLTHFEKRHGADPLKSAYSTEVAAAGGHNILML